MSTTDPDGLPKVAKTYSFDLPNPKAAQAYQEANANKMGPMYNVKTQSCVTYVCDVMSAGGLKIPEDPGGKLKYILRGKQ